VSESPHVLQVGWSSPLAAYTKNIITRVLLLLSRKA